MNKKQEFISYVEQLIEEVGDKVIIPEGASLYWETFKGKGEVEKPMFTEGGKKLLTFLQNNYDDTISFKARDIAEQMEVSSRTISGSIRKLVADGYVEKISQDPVIYMLTKNGKNVEII